MEMNPTVISNKKTVPFINMKKTVKKTHTELLKEAFLALELYEMTLDE